MVRKVVQVCEIALCVGEVKWIKNAEMGDFKHVMSVQTDWA